MPRSASVLVKYTFIRGKAAPRRRPPGLGVGAGCRGPEGRGWPRRGLPRVQTGSLATAAPAGAAATGIAATQAAGPARARFGGLPGAPGNPPPCGPFPWGQHGPSRAEPLMGKTLLIRQGDAAAGARAVPSTGKGKGWSVPGSGRDPRALVLRPPQGMCVPKLSVHQTISATNAASTRLFFRQLPPQTHHTVQ